MLKSHHNELSFSMLSGADVRGFVQRLATEYGVEYQETDINRFAESVTKLSDDDVMLDETEKLLIELARRDLISAGNFVELQVKYLRQKLGETI